MNDHYASIVHRDKAAQLHAEAGASRLAKSARDEGIAPRRGWFTNSRRRLAALAAAILPASGR